MLTFSIGDVHGCFDQLTELLAQCRRFAKGEPSRFVFLGDYIDRGPNSRGVIQTIMDMQALDPTNVIALAGNHEDLFLNTGTPEGMGRWIGNGGGATLRSYGVTSRKGMPLAHRTWLHELPLFYDDGLRFFVHAGIRPGVPLDRQTREDMLWIREPFLSSTADHGRLVIHGHTPLRNRKPDVRQNRIDIDTGAVFFGFLTAAVFNDTERTPIHFLQAPSAGPPRPTEMPKEAGP
jgi:serine/threonine protein phosphatase 1